MKRFLATTATVLIIVVAALAITTIVRRHLLASVRSPAMSELGLHTGQRFPANIDLAGHPKTIILALQAGCPYCAASAPFYRELIPAAAAKNVGVIMILPQPIGESEAYLTSLGLPHIPVYSTNLQSVGITGTPTLVMVDRSGEIMNVWSGQLPTELHQAVLSAL